MNSSNTFAQDPILLGVDTGGTFTDFVCVQGSEVRIHKVLSTPGAPEQAILQGAADLGLSSALTAGQVVVVHGSTVATNAALEGKGVRTVLITNRGFADLLTLARQNRADIYALEPAQTLVPVPPDLCLEVDCRRGAQGELVTPLSDQAINQMAEQVRALAPEAVAINLLFSYINGDEERRLRERMPESALVCLSSEVLPEYKEYERGMATWLNAWLGPKVAAYLQRLGEGVAPSPLAVMQSSGGTIDASQASDKAVNLLLSGPAGGLAAAKFLAHQVASPQLMTFDMGGTSTDVALLDGDVRLTSEGRLGPYPVAVPMVEMHTIGAGGGSLAYVDAGGLLHVGPESAGAEPGPACYGFGGKQPTVTDANAVLGRLRPDRFLGGRMTLDLPAAQGAMGRLGDALGLDCVDAALGVLALANEHMARALRVISVEKGFDPADFELCCFGGAGGLHVCALAEDLGMSRVLVPANGGVLSAFGMLVSAPHRQLSRSINALVSSVAMDDIASVAADLAQQGEIELRREGVNGSIQVKRSLDCRYQGQSHSLNLPWPEDPAQLAARFHQAHEHSNGHQLPLPVELVTVRVAVTGESPMPEETLLAERPAAPGTAVERVTLPELGATDVWVRDDLAVDQVVQGPAIVCETVATTLVATGWRAWCDALGHLHLRAGEV